MHSRQHAGYKIPMKILSQHTAILLGICIAAAVALAPSRVRAQQPRDTARTVRDTTRATTRATTDSTRASTDTARAATDSMGPRPERQPPLSPRRAFLYSLAFPGYSQSILGRGRAGTLELAFEAVALTMIRQSAADVREARRNAADSIPVSYVDASGAVRTTYERTAFPNSLVRSRRAHLEDWIAVLIANHLFSAADAYVAALLWDLPSEVALHAAPRSAALELRLFW